LIGEHRIFNGGGKWSHITDNRAMSIGLRGADDPRSKIKRSRPNAGQRKYHVSNDRRVKP
jgi:hypothetical protein